MRTKALFSCAAAAVVAVACGGSSGGSSPGGGADGGGTSPDGSASGSGGGSGGGSGSGSGGGSGSSSGGGSGSGSGGGSGSSSGGGSGSSSGSSGDHDAGACGSCPSGFTCSASGDYCVSAHGVPAFDHVYLIMMENESQTAITTALAPYINSLMTTYAYTKNYSTSYHPSLPNYIDITSGTDQDVACDCDPNSVEKKCAAGAQICLSCNCGGITAQHLGDQLDGVGVQWRNYGEGMGTACNLTATEGGNATHFAPKHVPFMYYQDVGGNSTVCQQRVVDYTSFAADLAAGTYRFSMIAPNLCDDMHGDTGCPSTNEVTQGDNWLKTEVPKILATPGFQPGGKDVLFIVWDEQTGSTGNASTPMLCIPVGPLVKGGTASTQAYTHESLLATFEEAFGLARLANAAQVPSPVNDVWK